MGNKGWIAKIIITSVAASTVFTLVSSRALEGAGYITAFATLALFVLIGIVFDVIGVAVTAASEAPFHSMAAHRERGAVEALRLIKNAEKVSSVCNDVVGDICGIVCGTMAALVAERLSNAFSVKVVILQLVLSGAVTGAMIGGKAAGKLIATTRTNAIILRVGQMISVFSRTGK